MPNYCFSERRKCFPKSHFAILIFASFTVRSFRLHAPKPRSRRAIAETIYGTPIPRCSVSTYLAWRGWGPQRSGGGGGWGALGTVKAHRLFPVRDITRIRTIYDRPRWRAICGAPGSNVRGGSLREYTRQGAEFVDFSPRFGLFIMVFPEKAIPNGFR